MFRLLRPTCLLAAAARSPGLWAASCGHPAVATGTLEVYRASPGSSLWSTTRDLHSTFASRHDAELAPAYDATLFAEPDRKFRSLGDKELWHEAWMYEDRFGSETQPIQVPSLEVERIIGVTDPEDESLIVWGILKAGEPPRQFIEGGEYYLLNVVAQVKKVGDVLLQLEAGQASMATPLAA